MSEFNLDNLSFPMRLKTDKVKKYKNVILKQKKYKKYETVLLGLMIVFIIMFALFCYIHISILCLFPVLLAFACLYISYFLDVKLYKTDKNYEKLRLDIIDSLKGKICIHHSVCKCKEEYYRYMYGLDIDIVFKP